MIQQAGTLDRLFADLAEHATGPRWTWRDHGHQGDRPMGWLDGLDLPMFQAMPALR